MGIKLNSSAKEVNDYFEKLKAKVETAVIIRLSRLGEELTNYAKAIPAELGYHDRTGNLRSSTGYVIVANGELVKSVFKKVVGSISSDVDGVSIGTSYAESLIKNHSRGYVLIVVAGMEYALAVESRGKDVLTTTVYKSQNLLPVHLRKLKQNIERMKI